jgi:hypothetical protein
MTDTLYEDVHAYKKQSSASRRILASFLIDLSFDPEDGYIFLRHVGFFRITWRFNSEDTHFIVAAVRTSVQHNNSLLYWICYVLS